MSTGFPIFQSIRMDLHSCQGEEIAGFGRESCVSLTTWLARHGVLWKVGMCPSLLWSQSQEGQGDTGTPTAPSPLPLSGLEGGEHQDEPLGTKGSTQPCPFWWGRMWGQSQHCQHKPQGAAGASPWQWGRGAAIPQLVAPQSRGQRAERGRLVGRERVWHRSGSGCCPSAAARSCVPWLSGALPKRTCFVRWLFLLLHK